MIADDNPDGRQLLRKIIEILDFEIREASNGQEALEIFYEWNPDLIFMDIRMPVIDGKETTRRIRASEKGLKTKIIAVTAHALEEERLEILAAGCDVFIRKPYKEREIFNALAVQLKISYIYKDDGAARSADLSKLDVSDFNGISWALIREFGDAVEKLDSNGCKKIIEKINESDSKLAARLSQMIKEMKFKELLSVTDKLNKKE